MGIPRGIRREESIKNIIKSSKTEQNTLKYKEKERKKEENGKQNKKKWVVFTGKLA